MLNCNLTETWSKRLCSMLTCLGIVVMLAAPTVANDDDVVMISDSFNHQSAQQRQLVRQAKRTKQPVKQASCDLGCCEVGCPLGDSCCGDDCCGGVTCGDCCCCCPWWAHCSGVSGEFLYLHATDVDVAHAQQQNGLGGAGTVPWGRVGTSAQHHEPGFRVAVDKAFSACSSLRLGYTFFESDSIDNLEAPVIPGGGGAVGSLVHHPGAAITASVSPVSAANDIDFQLADLQYRAIWKANECYAINWSVGGRYGNLVQDFRQIGLFSGGTAGQIETRSNVDFDGGGLLFGLDGERRLGCGGFSIYGRGSVSPLSGRFHSDYHLRNVTTDVDLAFADWTDDRIVTILECEAGLSYAGPCRRWRVSAGYLASFWFNAVSTVEFINTVQANAYDGVDDTIKFDGLTARIERRW